MSRADVKQPFWVQALNHQRSWRGWQGAFKFLMSLAQGGAEIYPDRKYQGASQFAYETIKVVKEAFDRIERGAYFDFKLLNRQLAAFHPEIDAFDPRDLKRKWRARDGVWKPRRFRFNLMPSAEELDDTEFLLMTLLGIILDEFMDYVRERYSDSKYPGWTRGRQRAVVRNKPDGEFLVLTRVEKTLAANPRVSMTAATGASPKTGKPVPVKVRHSLPAKTPRPERDRASGDDGASEKRSRSAGGKTGAKKSRRKAAPKKSAGAGKRAAKPAKKTVKKAGKRSVKQAAKKTARAKKPVKKLAKKAVKKTAKKATQAKKPAKKAVKKPTKKKSARKTR